MGRRFDGDRVRRNLIRRWKAERAFQRLWDHAKEKGERVKTVLSSWWGKALLILLALSVSRPASLPNPPGVERYNGPYRAIPKVELLGRIKQETLHLSFSEGWLDSASAIALSEKWREMWDKTLLGVEVRAPTQGPFSILLREAPSARYIPSRSNPAVVVFTYRDAFSPPPGPPLLVVVPSTVEDMEELFAYLRALEEVRRVAVWVIGGKVWEVDSFGDTLRGVPPKKALGDGSPFPYPQDIYPHILFIGRWKPKGGWGEWIEKNVSKQ